MIRSLQYTLREDMRVLQIGYTIATEICTAVRTGRTINVTTTYVCDFQRVMLILVKTNTLIIHAVLYGRSKYLSSEVKSLVVM
jgi:hypothetical protein